VAGQLRGLAGLLGLLTRDPQIFLQATPSSETETETGVACIEARIAERLAAKKNKDYAAADRIRGELLAAGVVLEDSAAGTTWRRS
jgi:cysteinyl-tRNA synthetase